MPTVPARMRGLGWRKKRCPSRSVSDMCLKFKKQKNSSAINANKEQAGAARLPQMIRQQDCELILFHKKDFELSEQSEILHGDQGFTGCNKHSGNFILLHRFVDKTDKEL